jgi:hypothetical protein
MEMKGGNKFKEKSLDRSLNASFSLGRRRDEGAFELETKNVGLDEDA